MKLFLLGVFAAVVALAIAGCSTTPELQTIAVAAELPKPVIPAECKADSRTRFPLVKVSPDGSADPKDLAQSYLTAKTRKGKDDQLANTCYCWAVSVAGTDKDKADSAAICNAPAAVKPAPAKAPAVPPEPAG